jgi:hypothetical protein
MAATWRLHGGLHLLCAEPFGFFLKALHGHFSTPS